MKGKNAGVRARIVRGGEDGERRGPGLPEGAAPPDIYSDMGCLPPSDVTEGDDAVRIILEMPGVSADKAQVTARGDRIEVTGEKPPDFPKGEISFLRLERGFGKFHRVFEVVGPVDFGKISARQKDGVLTITIPKMAERRGVERRIPVIRD